MGLTVAFVLEATNGGTARHVLDLAAGLVSVGHVVHVIYARRRAEPRFEEGLAAIGMVRTAVVDMRQAPHPSDLTACRAIRRYLQRHGPFDIVHGHSSKGGALARLAAAGLPGARVYTPHCFRTFDPALGRLARAAYGGIELTLSHLSDAIVAVSREEFEHALRIGISPTRLHVVFNGVDGTDRSGRAALRDELGLQDDEVCVGFLARYVPQKAPERLLEAAAHLKGDLPPFRLVLVGDGPLEARLRQQAAATGIAHRVVFASGSLGPAAMAAFDIFALPSAYEGMPYVALEAARAGLPIVATDVGGIRSIVLPERNGFIVGNGDARQFAHHLAHLLESKELRLRMGRESAEIGKAFTIEKMVRETLDVYDKVIRPHRSRRPQSASKPVAGRGVEAGRSSQLSGVERDG